MTRPVLDYVPRLDERNKAHRVTAGPNLANVARYWAPSTFCLNQQAEGACVGGGVVHEYGASPVRGRINDAMMFDLYRRAKQIDEFEGVDYEGTSVRAGMLVGRERGWYTGFKWALNMTELRAALELGPIVIGVEWREGMYAAPAGVVKVGGGVVGGHCLLITGYTPFHTVHKAPAYRWRNSWSPSYGLNGNAYIKAADLDSVLFKSGGEAAVAVGRHL